MKKYTHETVKLQNGWRLTMDLNSCDGKYGFVFIRGSRREKYQDVVIIKLTEQQLSDLYDMIHPQSGIGAIMSINENIIDANVYISQIRNIRKGNSNKFKIAEIKEISEEKSLAGFNGCRESVIMVSTETISIAITLDMFRSGSMRLMSIMEQILDINQELRIAR